MLVEDKAYGENLADVFVKEKAHGENLAFVKKKVYGENGENLADFRDFVSKKDPNEIYNWSDCNNCACGQYAKELGVKEWTKKIGLEWFSKGSDDFWEVANTLACPGPAYVTPFNSFGVKGKFGDLSRRLEERLALEGV